MKRVAITLVVSLAALSCGSPSTSRPSASASSSASVAPSATSPTVIATSTASTGAKTGLNLRVHVGGFGVTLVTDRGGLGDGCVLAPTPVPIFRTTGSLIDADAITACARKIKDTVAGAHDETAVTISAESRTIYRDLLAVDVALQKDGHGVLFPDAAFAEAPDTGPPAAEGAAKASPLSPALTVDSPVDEPTIVLVTKTALLAQSKPVIDYANLDDLAAGGLPRSLLDPTAKEPLVMPLGDALRKIVADPRREHAPGQASPELIFMADDSAPYSVVREVLSTATLVGFTRLRLSPRGGATPPAAP